MKAAFGEEGLDRLLEVRTREQIEAYQAIVPKKASLKRRLEALAAQRTEEGYMAEIITQADGTYLLAEKHCPISPKGSEAASKCHVMCNSQNLI